MSDLLEDLGALARARRVRDESPVEPSEDADANAARLMAPLEQERADAILDRVVNMAGERDATVVPLRRPGARLRWFGGGVAAAAAAVFLAISLQDIEGPPETVSSPGRDDSGALAYEVSFHDAPGGWRGSEAVVTYAVGDSVVLRLRPQQANGGAVAVEVTGSHGPHKLVLNWAAIATTDQGHLEIHGDAGDLVRVAEGEWSLEIKVVDVRSRTVRWRGQTRLNVRSKRASSG